MKELEKNELMGIEGGQVLELLDALWDIATGEGWIGMLSAYACSQRAANIPSSWTGHGY